VRRVPAAILVVLSIAAGVSIGLFAGRAVMSPSPSAVAQASTDPAGASADLQSPIPSDTATPTPTDTPAPTPTPVPTPVLVPDPLDGVPVEPSLATQHVVAVMIDDLWAARPQSGLSAASQVWQAPAEGGIPRYMALFSEGDPPAVGPIRSSRLYFIAWAAEWNAVYAHVGGSPQALSLLNSSQGRGTVVWNADEFMYGPAYMWRIKTRFAPHNVYTDGVHLRSLVKATKAPPSVDYTAHWQFAPDPSPDQLPVGGSVVVPYPENTISYAYDQSTNSYPRTVSSEGKEFDVGPATKVRIAPKNIVVIYMHFGPLNDGSHKNRLEAQFTGSGQALVFNNGGVVKATWKKASMTAPTLLYGPDGQPVTLTVGQTFVQVVPVGTAVTYKLGTPPGSAASPLPSGSASQ
jgi:Protein of unknown function (DUF3048) N-terminal domain/Protein of unknown function (DUF3048) C-terminal domain